MDSWEGACEQLILSMLVFFIVMFIVNKRNILTDGMNEREHVRRKYNEL